MMRKTKEIKETINIIGKNKTEILLVKFIIFEALDKLRKESLTGDNVITKFMKHINKSKSNKK